MRRVATLYVLAIVLATATDVNAQEPADGQAAAGAGQIASPSDLPPPIHPEVWRQLEQIRRYDSPRTIARMKAAEEAQQRRARLNAQRWYGYSPLRPIVGATPSMGNYYPIWNTDVPRPFVWYGHAHPVSIHAELLDVH
jgi:hypothetical protein